MVQNRYIMKLVRKKIINFYIKLITYWCLGLDGLTFVESPNCMK